MKKNLCILKRYKNQSTTESFTCDEVRELFTMWDEEFRKTNRVDISRADTYYDRWKKEIEDFLMKCNCETKEICESKNSGHWLSDQIEEARKKRKLKNVTMQKEIDNIIELLTENE